MRRCCPAAALGLPLPVVPRNNLEAMDPRAKPAIGQRRWSGPSLFGESRRGANVAVTEWPRSACDLRELQIMEFEILVINFEAEG